MAGGQVLRAALAAGSPYPTSAQDRIRSGAADPEDATPFAVFVRMFVDRQYGLDDTLLAVKETFHIFCWGKTPTEAQALEEEIVTALAAVDLVASPNEADGVDANVGDNCVVLTVDVRDTPTLVEH